jgi:hypothetical protein
MPTNIRKIDEGKTAEASSGFNWLTALFCVTVGLVITVSIFATVVSPTIWQETGVNP